MRIQYISDIHLEYLNYNEHMITISNIIKQVVASGKPYVSEENPLVLVLAGDIGDPFNISYYMFIKTLSPYYNHIFVISGNHEYYNTMGIVNTDKKISSICNSFENVTYLNNSSFLYKGIKWIGSTLWSNPSQPQPQAIINSSSTSSSSTSTSTSTSAYTSTSTYTDLKRHELKYYTIDVINDLHKKAVKFIEQELGCGEQELGCGEQELGCDENVKCIVITHHLPKTALILPEFSSKINDWYASDSVKINKNPILWIYGHTHKCNVKVIDDVTYICNPIGYKGENKGYDLCHNRYYKL